MKTHLVRAFLARAGSERNSMNTVVSERTAPTEQVTRGRGVAARVAACGGPDIGLLAKTRGYALVCVRLLKACVYILCLQVIRVCECLSRRRACKPVCLCRRI